MKQFRSIHVVLLTAAIFAANGAVTRIASAQPPAGFAGPGGPGAPGAPGGGGGGGTITNTQPFNVTPTTTTPGAQPGIAAPLDSQVASDVTTTDITTTTTGLDGEAMVTDTTLANTGGEPLLMSLAGMSLAGGAFFLRRRVA